MLVVVVFVGWLPNAKDNLAVFSAVGQYGLFLTIPLVGLAQGSAVVVAHWLGVKSYKSAIRVGLLGIIFAVGLAFMANLVYFVAPRALISVFLELGIRFVCCSRVVLIFAEAGDDALYNLAKVNLWITGFG